MASASGYSLAHPRRRLRRRREVPSPALRPGESPRDPILRPNGCPPRLRGRAEFEKRILRPPRPEKSRGRRRPSAGREARHAPGGRPGGYRSAPTRDGRRGRNEPPPRGAGRPRAPFRGGGPRPGRGSGRRETPFQDLLRELQRRTSIDPCERIRLETTPENFSTRALDLIAPIGKGQRCLIVSPPKAGKTTLLQETANAVHRNHPEIEILVLLVDERPEEVTHFRRSVHAEVLAASSDQTAADHVRVAEMALAKALEPVLAGRDVLILLDSITRLARAYNTLTEGQGRTLTGGLDAGTMQTPRQVFGAARKIEGGGSLTILGTALIDTGSRMDEVIFQEFKGTGNMELVLSRKLFEQRIFPCIDISMSGTRKEEKLYPPEFVSRLHRLRHALAGLEPHVAMEGLLTMLHRYPTNADLIGSLSGR